MKSGRYKAFISYSHKDESWAGWLHKALESYRVPKRLVGKQGLHGPVAHRLAPVFRDRDEFSSAADLSEKVREALGNSESLVVICSPAAARSRWVNEEIRHFRSLGRGDRVYCVIVAGDPQAAELEETCFPPALLESGIGEKMEPLAADARKWADGKLLAKLKVISGILGVRLDELRRREQKRRRKLQFAYALSVLIVVSLVAIAFVSRREAAARRAHAETLVTQIVEISEDLEEVADLETLRTIGERLRGYLDTLDANDLTPESRKQIALVLRQLGNVSMAQGRLEEALEAFGQSRAIFTDLAAESPADLEVLYQLGNAEFYVASAHVEQLDYESAEAEFINYRDVAAKLMYAEPGNAKWIMEMSYSYTNLAALAERSGKSQVQDMLRYMQAAIALLEQALGLEPDNDFYRSQYASTLSWYADAQMSVCDPSGALESRRKSEALARELSSGAPANNELKKQHAYALTNLATTQRQTGQEEMAEQSLQDAKRILDELVRLDPSNVKYRWEAYRLAAWIADLDSDTGRLAEGLATMKQIHDGFETVLLSNPDEIPRRRSQFAQYLLDYSDAALRSGDTTLATERLDEAIASLATVLGEGGRDASSLARLDRASFQWWELHGSSLEPAYSESTTPAPESAGPVMGCHEANLAARRAILNGDPVLAKDYTAYLLGRGYLDPDFVSFCARYELCDPGAEGEPPVPVG
jgi:tetratricopeptide (TPR) repeat protein